MKINLINIFLFTGIALYNFLITKTYYQRHKNSQKILVTLLFLVHFGAMYVAYDSPLVDPLVFYKTALTAESWISLFGLGSTFMAFLIYPLIKAGVSLFVLFFLFASISYQAFLWYFNQMASCYSNTVTIYGIPLVQFFFLLPSFHYWSSFLGKDALVFFILTYLLFEIKNRIKLNFLQILVLFVFLLLRPHFCFVVFIAGFIYYFTENNIGSKIRIKLLLGVLAIIGVLFPVVMQFLNITNFSSNTLQAKWIGLSAYATQSSSGINLMESSYLDRLWLLMFRPLYYDAVTFYQYVISIENSFVLLFFIIGVIYIFLKGKEIRITGDVKFALLTGSLLFLMIASYIYNLGLASRMRLSFLPLFFYVVHQLFYLQETQQE
jgi:hypothetical protein